MYKFVNLCCERLLKAGTMLRDNNRNFKNLKLFIIP